MSAEISTISMSSLSHHETIIEKGFSTAYDSLLVIRDQILYKPEYSTFEEYCTTRWNISRRRAYQLIDAAKVASNISATLCTSGTQKPTSERQLRPLTSLPKTVQADAWKKVVETTKGKPTAKAVQEEVDRRLPPKPSAPLTSKINGVDSIDPPDIARLRAAGKIKPDSIVTIVEPEPEPEPEVIEPGGQDSEADDPETDEAFLASLPIREKLNERQRKRHDADAMIYRNLDAHRKTFAYHAIRSIGKKDRDGHYAYRTLRYLKTDHPKHWLLCPSEEYGGCSGTGEVMFIGRCPKCFGQGYRINA